MFIIISAICLIIIFLLLNYIPIFKKPYTGNIIQKGVIVVFVLIFICAISCKPIVEQHYIDEEDDIYNKYLVNSIIQGKASIDLEPSEALKNLENPYDIYQRRGVEYSQDTAYYNGKYYVYYGVVPALLIFVPYTLATGDYLPTWAGTYIFVILSIITTIMLIIKIYKRWFSNIPFKMLFIFLVAGLLSGVYIWNTWRMWAYELTLISGYFFVQLGLILMLSATEKLEKISYIDLFLSCLCMALAVGCRPTLVLSSALLLPFLYAIIKNTDKKRIVKTVLVIVIPYLIVAIPMMIYNYVRFDSIFEFGAKYQLTVVNVTDATEKIQDIPKGLYQYFLQPPNLKSEYPYIEIDKSTDGFSENYYNGGMVSGILFLNLTMISCLWGFRYWKKEKDGILKGLITLLPIVGIVMAIAVVVMGGSIQRYSVDFFWLFSMLGMIIWFYTYQEQENEKVKTAIFLVIYLLVVASYALQFIGTFLTAEYDYLKLYWPEMYQKIEGVIGDGAKLHP